MAFKIKAKIEGLNPLLKKLESVAHRTRTQALRKGLRRGTAVVLASAKGKVPVRTGWLKRALATKVKASKKGAYGVVGALAETTRDSKGKRKRTRLGRAMDKAGVTGVSPSKYAHLVEYGHGGPAPAPPHPFLRPALDEQSGAVVSALAEAVSEVVGR
jgi:HK97 gp10 family phage protein